MKAKDLMTETGMSVPRDMLVTDLAGFLREKRLSGVPVADEDGKICGIVTIADLFNVMNIVRKVGGKRDWFLNFVFSKKTMTVKEIYTRKMYSVLPEAPVEAVVSLMLDKGIHTIPVMNELQTEIHGIIGRHDVTCAALGNGPKKEKKKD